MHSSCTKIPHCWHITIGFVEHVEQQLLGGVCEPVLPPPSDASIRITCARASVAGAVGLALVAYRWFSGWCDVCPLTGDAVYAAGA